MEPSRHRVGEDDLRGHLQLASTLGLEGDEAAAALLAAFELDRIGCGGDVDAFADRWVPSAQQGVRVALRAAIASPPKVMSSDGEAARTQTAARAVSGARGAPAATRRSAQMIDAFDQLPAGAVESARRLAERRIGEWHALRGRDGDRGEAFAYVGFDEAPQGEEVANAVWLVDDVLSRDECERVLAAVRAAAERRGGWDKDRHGRYPTTDMPLAAVPEVEGLVRAAVFSRVLRAVAQLFLPRHFLPEHLELRDAFYVKYSAAAGQQRDLQMHTDGSIFSFNLTLNDPAADFDGGGTYFEPTGLVVQAARGGAVAHSGQVRHSGLAITRGERYLLVGFVGCATHPYSLLADRGASDTKPAAARMMRTQVWEGAWDRSADAPAPRRADGPVAPAPAPVMTAEAVATPAAAPSATVTAAPPSYATVGNEEEDDNKRYVPVD